MAYPKPLSERSIKNLYADTRMTQEQIDFLHRFVTACANLYGVILAEDVWKVYQDISGKPGTVRVLQKNLFQALEIMRREDIPFRVCEIDEIYKSERRSDRHRLIVHNYLIGAGYYQYEPIHSLMANISKASVYIPEDLLDYAERTPTKAENVLLDMLADLQSVDGEYQGRRGQISPCPSKGKHLDEFSAFPDPEDSCTTALQVLMNELKLCVWEDVLHVDRNLNILYNHLHNLGVAFAEEEEVHKLTKAVLEYMNEERTWVQRGNTLYEQGLAVTPEKLEKLHFEKVGSVTYGNKPF